MRRLERRFGLISETCAAELMVFSIARLCATPPADPSASLSYGREIGAGCVLERLWVDPVFDHIQGSSGDCNWVVLVFDFCSK